MKKYVFVFILFWILSLEAFSQNSVSRIVSECTGFLGKGVPAGFSLFNNVFDDVDTVDAIDIVDTVWNLYDTAYGRKTSDGLYTIFVKEGIVVGSSFMVTNLSYDEARRWVLSFISFYENNNWKNFFLSDENIVYKKSSIFTSSPSISVDVISFRNDVSVFFVSHMEYLYISR